MKQACKHCGLIFLPTAPGECFCCGGCQAVAGLLAREGLEEFYVRRDAPGQPVSELPEVHSAWAKVAQAESEAAGISAGEGHLRAGVTGMTCAGCAWLIECLFERESGATRCVVSLTGGYVDLWWNKDSDFQLLEFFERLAAYGYGVKAYRCSQMLKLAAPHGYGAMGLIFSLNGVLLGWLNQYSDLEEIAEPAILATMNGLLWLSLLAGATCWFLWVYRLRAMRETKGVAA